MSIVPVVITKMIVMVVLVLLTMMVLMPTTTKMKILNMTMTIAANNGLLSTNKAQEVWEYAVY